MKKLILFVIIFTCFKSYSQTIEQRAGFYSDGTVGKIRSDTIYPLLRNPLFYWNSYGNFVALADSIPFAFTGNAGTIYYNNGTKLIGLSPGTSSQILYGGTTPFWSAASTGTLLAGDTSFLTINANNYANSGYPFTTRKGIYLTNYSAAPQSSPPIYMRSSTAYAGGYVTWGKMFVLSSTGGGVSAQLNYQSSLDSSTWTTLMTLNTPTGLTITGKGNFSSDITGFNIFTPNATVSNTGQVFSGIVNQFYDQVSSFRGIGNRGITPNTLTTTNRFQATNGIMTVNLINGGSGGTNGVFSNIPTVISGAGSIIANMAYTISGGAITAIVNPLYSNTGNNFYVGDTIALNQHGLTGTKIVVTKIWGQSACGTLISDTIANKLYRFDCNLNKQVPILDSTSMSGNLITSISSTLTLVQGNDYIFTGSTATYTLPAISATAIGRANIIYIKNRGSGSITLNSASGSTIYTSSAQSTLTIAASDGIELLPDGTYFNVMFNNAIL